MADISIRERLLQTVEATLTPIATQLNAGFHRSPTVPLRREECPALVLHPESDSLIEHSNDRVTRTLQLRLLALARDTQSTAQADELLTAAHRALFIDTTFGQLALSLTELDTEWDIEDADAIATSIPARYRITYRTRVGDLALLG